MESPKKLLSFRCDGRLLYYSNDQEIPHHWGWGEVLKDRDFIFVKDESFLIEILEVWKKTPEYQKELMDNYYKEETLKKKSSFFIR